MKVIKLPCPKYNFDKTINIEKVSKVIDAAIVKYFNGQSIILRGIQSKKHNLSKADLIQNIISQGYDRYETSNQSSVDVSENKIDIFGYACLADSLSPITLNILKGFHVYKPKSLERPQYQVDIWMIYDASKLDNVGYFHKAYEVMANDGYNFKNPNDKAGALIGMIVVE